LFFSTSNPELVMPPKPLDKQRAMAFYNIDFSLQNQLRLVGQQPQQNKDKEASPSSGTSKDAVQRKKDFIRRRRHQADQTAASKVIQVCFV
jgi:hypothetical protein